MKINSRPNAPNDNQTAHAGTAAGASGTDIPVISGLTPAEQKPTSLAALGHDLLQVALRVNDLHQRGLLPTDMDRLRRDEVYAFGLLTRGFKPELIAQALQKPLEELQRGLRIAQAIFSEPKLFA